MKCSNKYCFRNAAINTKYCSTECAKLVYRHDKIVDKPIKVWTGLRVHKNKLVREDGKKLYFTEPLPDILTTCYPYQ